MSCGNAIWTSTENKTVLKTIRFYYLDLLQKCTYVSMREQTKQQVPKVEWKKEQNNFFVLPI